MANNWVRQELPRQRGWTVETSCGTEFVPGDVLPVPDWLADNAPITGALPDTAIFDSLAEDLRPYCEGHEIRTITAIRGYFGRYSMPGYLDCSPWCFGTTPRELRASLAPYGGEG